MRVLLQIAVASMLCLGGPAWASGPSTGDLQGVVTGELHGEVIPRVSVTLRSETSPLVRVRSTDTEGVVEFLDLPAGLYSLETRLEGYERTLLQPILVLPDRTIVENVEIAVAKPEPPPLPEPIRPAS